MKKVRLKRGQERRLLAGSLWIFSNQIDDPIKDYLPGEIVRVTERNGKFLGVGYINPHSLIAVRILTREDRDIDRQFFLDRFRAAQSLREKILPDESAVREVFSESDGLPGLVLDRYADRFVMQISTIGMDKLKTILVDCVQEIYQPATLYERSDISVRKLEGLEPVTGLISGLKPDKLLWVKFADILLPVDIVHGQKTGLFLDQRRNLEPVTAIARGGVVLDAFSYVGAWGLKAARAGAEQVIFLDSSQWALDQALKAARRNRVASSCRALKSDAFSAMQQFDAENRRFDLIILDPPSFIPSRSHFKDGYKGFFDLNQRAMRIIKPGGFLVSCSCSHLLGEAEFNEMLLTVANRCGRKCLLLYKGRQGPDHPVLPPMPETEYLHCSVLKID
jgi:23S rRNA (cytosine1962-C5)-methyltransferase